jgi:hypothetical protein
MRYKLAVFQAAKEAVDFKALVKDVGNDRNEVLALT